MVPLCPATFLFHALNKAIQILIRVFHLNGMIMIQSSHLEDYKGMRNIKKAESQYKYLNVKKTPSLSILILLYLTFSTFFCSKTGCKRMILYFNETHFDYSSVLNIKVFMHNVPTLVAVKYNKCAHILGSENYLTISDI